MDVAAIGKPLPVANTVTVLGGVAGSDGIVAAALVARGMVSRDRGSSNIWVPAVVSRADIGAFSKTPSELCTPSLDP
ncbi:hypothetical protein MPNT_80029 [Candidatus Methylacidithermus pantelleriae]|uniref:Uncharacterized protein n=1 Tax=Candidatus Methylacidithermus pantelleriae TaxID=2744239 RepID=A0A8J2BNE8_9BACT|nr:hypothetical protein MPNT_80029 [Candidatus Methylacidithermus pantelleriae]